MMKKFFRRLWFKFMGWIHNGYAVCDLCGCSVYNAKEIESWESHSYVCAGQNIRLKVVSMDEFMRQRQTGLIKLSFEEFLAQQNNEE